jgi:putative DNA primase/helicase
MATMPEPPHLVLIRALGGNEATGMAVCPAHDDARPSLHIGAGYKVPVVLHCHAGCSFAQITTILREQGRWPVPGTVTASRSMPRRSDEERRQYALRLLDDTRRNRGRENAHMLKDYFARRGIDTVPVTAMLALPWAYVQGALFVPNCPGMIFSVTDGQCSLGIHVTWLNGDLSNKREEQPQRQFFGPIKRGYVKLYRGAHDRARPLLIAEGIETAAAVAQITGLPTISALSAENMPTISPPSAAEYIICADNDANGTGQQAARALARNLVADGHAVRIALPEQPDADWNDVVMNEVKVR